MSIKREITRLISVSGIPAEWLNILKKHNYKQGAYIKHALENQMKKDKLIKDGK